MSDSDAHKTFRTLRGFLDGEEPNEESYFCFMASLRIQGDGVPFQEITRQPGVEATHQHRKGDQLSPNSRGYPHDMWLYKPSVAETEPLERHIDALWSVVQLSVDYLKSLKQSFDVDVFCGYRSNCGTAGFEVPHTCLKLFTALEVPFGMSVIIV